MIIVIKGGLGNQMFQYAFGYLRSQKLKKRLYVLDLTQGDSRSFSLGIFGVDRSLQNQFLLTLSRFFCFTLEVLSKKVPLLTKFYLQDLGDHKLESSLADQALLLDGYWQRAAYFIEDKEKIKSLYSFPSVPATHQLIDFSDDKKYVAMHVRRGDYVSASPNGGMHLVCDVDWYLKSLEFLKSKVANIQVVIFSDDELWVKEQFGVLGPDVHIVPSNDAREPWIDLYFISCCDHFILSNSSYSWWGAFLGETSSSFVVVPKFWFKGVRTEAIGICPSHWHQI